MNHLQPPQSHRFLKISALFAVLSCPVYADPFTWNGGGANDDWSSGANWDGGVPPTSAPDTIVEFSGNNRLTPNADVPWSLGGLTFGAGAGAFTITGANLELTAGGSVTNVSTNTQTIANSIKLPGTSTWDTSGGDLTVTGAITGNQEFFDFSGAIVKIGAGTLTLSGSNTYGQGTTVKNGTLAIVTGGVVANGAAYANVTAGEVSGDVGSILVDGGRLDTGSLIIGDNGSTGNVVINDGIFSSSSQILIGGGFAGGGAGNFEVHGGELSTFGTTFVGYVGTGTMTVTGGTWVGQNGVTVGSNGGTGVVVVSGGSLTFDGGTSIDVGSSLTISGSASYTHAGMDINGSFLLDGGVVTGTSQASIGGIATVNSGTWIQTGETMVGLGGSGTLNVNGGYVSTTNTPSADTLIGVLGEATVNVSSGTWAHAGNLSAGGYYYEGIGGFGGTADVSVTGGLVNVSGTLFLGAGTGEGTLTITGSNGNRGVVSVNNLVEGTGMATLHINGGILQAKADESAFLSGFEAGDVTFGEEGAIIDTQAFSVGIATSLGGAGGLTVIGSGTLALSGSNTFVGDTQVSDGTLLLLAGSEHRFLIGDGNAGNQILGTGNLDLDGTFRLDIGGLTDNSGTWNLVAAGTLTETYGASFGLAFVDGPTFVSDGSGNYTSGNWTYSESTGNLILVPEPASAGLLIGGVALAFFGRRQRRRG